jgi:drug/metabolite transporter (DMT)-like permease
MASISSFLTGVLAALFAAFVWALNFIVPFVIGKYSLLDLALLRFLESALICLAFIAARRHTVALLRPVDWLLAAWLGVIGYLGYFLALAGAALYAGPIIAPAILGLVPVVLAISGNLRHKFVPWRALALPLMLIFVGLLLIREAPQDNSLAQHWTPMGVLLGVVAVALWTWFGLLNQSALARRPGMDAAIWTAIIMVGAGVGMLAFAPVALKLGLFAIPQLGLSWEAAGALYLWSAVLAIFASIGGAFAWTVASQHLPVALSSQLVVMEAVFGAILGLIVHRRMPSLSEVMGMGLVVTGVVVAIRAFDIKQPMPASP